MFMPGGRKKSTSQNNRVRPVDRSGLRDVSRVERRDVVEVDASGAVDYGYEDHQEEIVSGEEEFPSDIEATKRHLRRLSLQMNGSFTSPRGKPALQPLEDEVTDDEESIIEEIVESDDGDAYSEEEDDSEILEEVIEDEEEEAYLDNMADETSVEVEETETGEIEEVEDEEEEEEEDDEEEDEATEEEVREAIVYILKQEKPIDRGHLTPAQATKMMALPFPAMKEIMKHFELCDNAGEPICWNQIAELVTPEGEATDDDDDDDDENEVDGDPSEYSEGRAYLPSLSLQPNDSFANSSISFMEGTDNSDYDPKTLKEYPVSPRSQRSNR